MKALRVRFGSISARLVLMLAVVAVAVFTATGYLLHKALEQVPIADERSDLSGKTELMQHFIDEVGSPASLPTLRLHLAATSVGGRSRWNVWFITREGELHGVEPMPPTRKMRRSARLNLRTGRSSRPKMPYQGTEHGAH